MSPSGGAMTTVDPSMTWSPEKSICSSTSEPAQVVRGVPRRVQRPQDESRARAARSRHRRRGSGRNRHARRSRAPRRRCAPPGAAAPGAWSGCVWVTTIQRMRPAPRSTRASQMAGVVGARDRPPPARRSPPGRCSSPGRSSSPGLGAVTRTTRADSATGRPGSGDGGRIEGNGRGSPRTLGATVSADGADDRRPHLRRAHRPPVSRRRGRRRRRLRRTRDRRGAGSGSPARRPPPGGARWEPAPTAAAAARSSPLVVKRLIASRFFMVGKMRSNSPALARASASSGRTHTVSTVSWSSWMGTWPGGSAATKKRVS